LDLRDTSNNPRWVSTAILSADTATVAEPQGERRWPLRWLHWAWIAVAAVPFLIAAGHAATRSVTLGADFALSGLAISDAAHLHQLVGPYSRMGWSHPGPTWFYLLAPVFTLLGSTGAALHASFLVLQALWSALLVAAAGRSRPWAQPVAALALLVYCLRMPTIVLVNPWNPFALLIPASVLLVLAGRGAAGSLPALVGAGVVGSFMVQTHVGTAPLVVAVCAGAAAAWVFTRTLPSRKEWALTAAGVALVVAEWVPPLWQQLRAPAGQGNLAQLVHYFANPGDAAGQPHSWVESAIITGRLLGVPVYGWPAGDQLVPLDELSPAGVALLVLQGSGTLLLAFVGWRARHREAVALALVLAAAGAATLFAMHSLRGDVYDYLVLWCTVLPMVLGYGLLELVLARWRLGRPAAVAAVALTAYLSVSLGTQVNLIVGQLGHEAGVRDAVALLDGHLGDRDDPIILEIGTVEAWPTVTGLAQVLEHDGYQVHVHEPWVHVFGASRAVSGHERLRVVLSDATVQAGLGVPALGTVDGQLGAWTVTVTPAPFPAR
jgi:hypothetical protein